MLGTTAKRKDSLLHLNDALLKYRQPDIG